MRDDTVKLMTALVQATETFLTKIRQEALDSEAQTAALQHLLARRQALFGQLSPEPLQGEARTLGLRLNALDQDLHKLVFEERQRLQRDLVKLRQGKKAHRGYKHQPLKGRRTFEVEG